MKIASRERRRWLLDPPPGIGHAVAKGLAAAGADVTVNGRTQDKVDAAVTAIAKAVPGARVRGVAASVSTVADATRW